MMKKKSYLKSVERGQCIEFMLVAFPLGGDEPTKVSCWN